MSDRHILLVGPRHETVREALAISVLTHWEGDPPTAITLSFEELLDPARSAQHAFNAGVIWLFLDEGAAGSEELNPVLDWLRDKHLPAMASMQGEERPVGSPFVDHVITAPPTAPLPVLCAMLRTLWNQAPMLAELRAELKLLRAHQGGLCEQ